MLLLAFQITAAEEDFKLANHTQRMEREIELMKLNFSAETDALQKVIKIERKKSAKNVDIIEDLKSKLAIKVWGRDMYVYEIG